MTAELPSPDVDVSAPALDAQERRLREKAAGKRNTVGDTWGDWICREAADAIRALRERVRQLESAPTSEEANAAIDGDPLYREIDAAIDRATLAAKVSGFTAPTRDEAMKSMQDVKDREEELRLLVRRMFHAAGYELNRQQAREIARLQDILELAKSAGRDAAERADNAEQERDALSADAERYRWLREESAKKKDFYEDGPRWMVSKEFAGMGENYFGPRIDAAIDAARQAAGEP